LNQVAESLGDHGGSKLVNQVRKTRDPGSDMSVSASRIGQRAAICARPGNALLFEAMDVADFLFPKIVGKFLRPRQR